MCSHDGSLTWLLIADFSSLLAVGQETSLPCYVGLRCLHNRVAGFPRANDHRERASRKPQWYFSSSHRRCTHSCHIIFIRSKSLNIAYTREELIGFQHLKKGTARICVHILKTPQLVTCLIPYVKTQSSDILDFSGQRFYQTGLSPSQGSPLHVIHGSALNPLCPQQVTKCRNIWKWLRHSSCPCEKFSKNNFFFFFFWLCCTACGILAPRPGFKPMPPCVGSTES